MVTSGNRVYGLEVYLREDGKQVYNLCELEKIKSVINIVGNHTNITDLNKIKQLIKNDFPLCVIITGKGILAKSDYDIKNPSIHQFFPGINIADFYFDPVNYNNVSYGTLARKKTVDDLIYTLCAEKLNVVSVAFGLSIVYQVLQVIGSNIMQQTISVHSISISIANNITDTNNDSAQISIGDEVLRTEAFTAYCTAIAYYLEITNSAVENERVAVNNKEYHQGKKLVTYSLIFAGSILAIILVSTIANFYYSSSYKQLNLSEAAHSNNGARDSLIAQISQKKKFLLEENWTGTSKASFYADRIAASVANGISLTGLNIYPLKTLSSDESELDFKEAAITIKGIAGNELILKNWLETLKQFNWQNSVEVINYEWNSKEREGEFELQIQLK